MRYTIQGLIGEGGWATVHRVVDEIARVRALKRLKEDTTDGKKVARFRQEVRIQSALRHPNIMPVVFANVADDRPFYVMPMADRSLEGRISEIAADNTLLQPIAVQLLAALEYSHSQNVLHRDIKPRNVLMFGDEARLSDFGLGKDLDYEASYSMTTSDRWGTYWYSPPEQERGLAHCDERSDVYSLGKLFLPCLAGDRAGQIPVALDQRWAYIISRCIADDPDARWQSVRELQRRFEQVFGINEPLVVDPDDLLGELAGVAQLSAVSHNTIEAFAAKVALLGEDEVLLRNVFDRLPVNLAAAWQELDPEGLKRLILAYDSTLSDNLSFEYCDVVADQYAMIHAVSNDPEIRDLIRKRLFRLGPCHNRWHVGSVFGRVLSTVRNPAEIVSVLDLIAGDDVFAAWNRAYLQEATIDARIREALPSEAGT